MAKEDAINNALKEYWSYVLTIFLVVAAFWFFWIYMGLQLYYALAIIGAIAAVLISGLSFLYTSTANLYITFKRNSDDSSRDWVMRLHNAGPGVATSIKLYLKLPNLGENSLYPFRALGPQGEIDVESFKSIPAGSSAELRFHCGALGLRFRHYQIQFEQKEELVRAYLIT